MTLLGVFFGMPGWVELLIVGGIALLLFGHRLPGVMRSLGKGITEFKKGINDTSDDTASAPDDKEKAKANEE